MLAYEVHVDGERIALAGMPDWGVMSVIVSATHGGGGDADETIDHTLHIGGMTRDLDGIAYHARWKGQSITIGSEIRIKILNSDNPDVPTKRFRSDSEVYENPYTEEEMREMRYQDYLQLKIEFEARPPS